MAMEPLSGRQVVSFEMPNFPVGSLGNIFTLPENFTLPVAVGSAVLRAGRHYLELSSYTSRTADDAAPMPLSVAVVQAHFHPDLHTTGSRADLRDSTHCVAAYVADEDVAVHFRSEQRWPGFEQVSFI